MSQLHCLAKYVWPDLAKALVAKQTPEPRGETLGWSFDSDRPHVTMTPRRLWKLKLAVDELLRQGWGSGQLVERIVGHCTLASLLRRELLSCFQAVYVFVRKRYHVHGRLWPEVVRELRWISSLLPLCHRNLGAEWSPNIFAVDASTWGRGVVTAKGGIDLADHFDRWRFKLASMMKTWFRSL